MRLCCFYQVSTTTEWSEQKSVFRILRIGHLNIMWTLGTKVKS